MSILKAALLGRSLSHSISPEVHRVLFRVLRENIDAQYDTVDYQNIECEGESDFLSHVRNGVAEGFTGFNITFPYKFVASQLENDTSSLVRQINSANMIALRSPLVIRSTDGAGFVNALHKRIPNFNASPYTLLIIGAGGAARAVEYAMRNFPWRETIVAVRSPKEAQRSFPNVRCIALNAVARDTLPYFVVQATPVGQRSNESVLQDFEWTSTDIAADLVYNPLMTRFLDRAKNGGATTIDGLGMLIEQAALSQYLWMTGEEVTDSPLSFAQFQMLHNALAAHVQQRWDDSAI